MTFEKLGLVPEVLTAIDALEYTANSRSGESYPLVLDGKDVMATDRHGENICLCTTYLASSVQKEIKKSKRTVRALILTPTRELASQVGKSVEEAYGKRFRPHECGGLWWCEVYPTSQKT